MRPLLSALFHRLPASWRHRVRRIRARTQQWKAFSPWLAARTQAQLRRCFADDEPSFWFLPSLSWFSKAFQRPQQLALGLSEVGCPVVYCEPWEAAGFAADGAAKERNFRGFRTLSPRLHLLRCPPEMIASLIEATSPSALLMMWTEQAPFIPIKRKSLVVYEMVDDHSLTKHADSGWNVTHERWVREADVMVATAELLLAQLTPKRPNVLMLPNAVRLQDWSEPSSPVPYDMRMARSAPVVVGYHGVLAEWFDWEMWEHAAEKRPDWAFVLVGPTYLLSDDEVRNRLARRRNIHYLGPKDYRALRHYTAQFDVATIPFRLNPITHACSPVKLFEYMAAGKPIVATRMHEILKYHSVLFTDSTASFPATLDAALASRSDLEYRVALQREAEANTWTARALQLRNAVQLRMQSPIA